MLDILKRTHRTHTELLVIRKLRRRLVGAEDTAPIQNEGSEQRYWKYNSFILICRHQHEST
jgi:hypothetical protein